MEDDKRKLRNVLRLSDKHHSKVKHFDGRVRSSSELDWSGDLQQVSYHRSLSPEMARCLRLQNLCSIAAHGSGAIRGYLRPLRDSSQPCIIPVLAWAAIVTLVQSPAEQCSRDLKRD